MYLGHVYVLPAVSMIVDCVESNFECRPRRLTYALHRRFPNDGDMGAVSAAQFGNML